MANLYERWIDSLEFSSLFWPPPQDAQQRQDQIIAYVEYFAQFTSDRFPNDIDKLIRSRYPSTEKRLLDEVLAMFVLHHPEHGVAVLLPIISCIIDGTLVYDKTNPPFSSFISLVCPSSESDYHEQWALACGEILRVLTHYNRPIYKADHQNREAERSSSGSHATTSKGKACYSPLQQQGTKLLRPLSPWITDILVAAPLGIRSDYFRWCGGVMGKYAAGGELRPPTTACGSGSGKQHPQIVPSTPRWAVANGAGVILSVCDEEVSRYQTATLTAAAVPALLLPPPTTALDEHLVAGLPALEPYAQLFHRYYAIATPSATQRLLFGLLEAPPSWAPDALDAAVQLVELIRSAEDYSSSIRLPRNWMHLHFLHAIGTAMSMKAGIAAQAAAAFLFRILSQSALLFPPLKQAEGLEFQNEPPGEYGLSYRKQAVQARKNEFDQMEVPAIEATIEATAQGIASMFCSHGPEVEWRICTIWEAAYGLIPLSSSAVDLPEIIVASPLQFPVLSWNRYLPLLKVLEYLPHGSASEACLMRIFVATVEAIIRRTYPPQCSRDQIRKSRNDFGMESTSKKLAVAELQKMVHSLFLESCASMDLASRLLFVVLTVCIGHEAHPSESKRPRCDAYPINEASDDWKTKYGREKEKPIKVRKQGPVAAFDSYVLASVCALACELQLLPMISKDVLSVSRLAELNGSSNELQICMYSTIHHTRRILGILEALLSLNPSFAGTPWRHSSNEIIAAAMVAAHISELFRWSKACMHALNLLMQCKWDNEIYMRASSLYNLMDIHDKAVASIANEAEPLEVQLVNSPLQNDASICCNSRKHKNCSNNSLCGSEHSSTLHCKCDKDSSNSITFVKCEKELLASEGTKHIFRRSTASLEKDASDEANFLTIDTHIGVNCSAQALLRSVFAEKQDFCFSVVSLLWYKLIAAPETKVSEESTSAQQEWRQVVDALCDVVSASPAKASVAIVLQAKKDLQSWIPRNDMQGQNMWIINQRIVTLLVELMRSHDSLQSLVTLVGSSDLLLCATDGVLVNGEECTLPQLELLEATARAVQLMHEWGNTTIMDGLSNQLKCRLPATTQCLSHPSAHVRALSMSVLRNFMLIGSIKFSSKHEDMMATHGHPYRCSSAGVINWHKEIEKCLTWEAHSRHATQMMMTYLTDAARELGCNIPI